MSFSAVLCIAIGIFQFLKEKISILLINFVLYYIVLSRIPGMMGQLNTNTNHSTYYSDTTSASLMTPSGWSHCISSGASSVSVLDGDLDGDANGELGGEIG